MIRARTGSAEETRRLAATVADLARPGDLFLLSGELGAGKTVFVQGLAAALGVDEPVTSPTFTLVRTYPGRIQVVHADLYRLEHLQEVIDLGLAELFDERSVALVEWGDVAAPLFAPDYLSVRIDTDPSATEVRLLDLRPVGPRWGERAERLRQAIAEWTAP